MAEKRPDTPKATSAQTLQQQYEELCQLRAELARLQAIVATTRPPHSK
jgi:hypothetical protein